MKFPQPLPSLRDLGNKLHLTQHSALLRSASCWATFVAPYGSLFEWCPLRDWFALFILLAWIKMPSIQTFSAAPIGVGVDGHRHPTLKGGTNKIHQLRGASKSNSKTNTKARSLDFASLRSG